MLEIKKIDVSTVLLKGMFRKQFLKSLSLSPFKSKSALWRDTSENWSFT